MFPTFDIFSQLLHSCWNDSSWLWPHQKKSEAVRTQTSPNTMSVLYQKKHRSWVSIKQVSHWSSVQMRHSSQRVRNKQPTSIHEGKAGHCSSDGSGDLNALILGFIHHLCTEWVWTSVYFATRQLSSWVVILSCCRLEHHPNLRMGRGHRTSREGT